MQYTQDSHSIEVNHSFKVKREFHNHLSVVLTKPKVITLAEDVHNGLKQNKRKEKKKKEWRTNRMSQQMHLSRLSKKKTSVNKSTFVLV